MLGCSEANHFDRILAWTLMILSIIHNVNINKTVFKQTKLIRLN